MARTAITPITVKGPNPVNTANALDFVFTAADASNGNKIAITTGNVLIVYNSHATTSYTFTLTSAACSHGRTMDVTTYSLSAGEYAAFKFTDLSGWKQTDGTLYLSGENAAVKFALLKI